MALVQTNGPHNAHKLQTCKDENSETNSTTRGSRTCTKLQLSTLLLGDHATMLGTLSGLPQGKVTHASAEPHRASALPIDAAELSPPNASLHHILALHAAVLPTSW